MQGCGQKYKCPGRLPVPRALAGANIGERVLLILTDKKMNPPPQHRFHFLALSRVCVPAAEASQGVRSRACVNRSSTSLAVCLADVQSVSCRRGSLAKLHAFARVRIVSSRSLAKQQKRKECDQNLAEERPIACTLARISRARASCRTMSGIGARPRAKARTGTRRY